MERRLPKKISITEEQFRTMFKIVGVREDGTVENRGRKPSVDQNDIAK
jgi:D-alanyl-D-alanine carboxypeptidase